MKEPYQNLTWHSRKMIDHRYPLTEKEKLELADKMVEARLKCASLEYKLGNIKKIFKDKIDAEGGKASEAARYYKSGLGEPVEIEVDVYQDFDRDEMVFVPVGSNTELKRRPMSESEKRPNLLSMIPGAQITVFPKDATDKK